MKAYKITAFAGAAFYFISGILIIGSIINGTTGLFINLIIGTLFICAAYYLYLRAENIIKLSGEIRQSQETDQSSSILKRFLLFEYIFIYAGNFIGMVFLYGVLHRVFSEKMPVFG